MNVSIYLDVYPWTRKAEDIFVTTAPRKHGELNKRYRVDVEIPDPAEPDEIIKGIAIEESFRD